MSESEKREQPQHAQYLEPAWPRILIQGPALPCFHQQTYHQYPYATVPSTCGFWATFCPNSRSGALIVAAQKHLASHQLMQGGGGGGRLQIPADVSELPPFWPQWICLCHHVSPPLDTQLYCLQGVLLRITNIRARSCNLLQCKCFGTDTNLLLCLLQHSAMCQSGHSCEPQYEECRHAM